MKLAEQISLECETNPSLTKSYDGRGNKKLSRFRTRTGLPVAVQTDGPRIWCLADHGRKASHLGLDARFYPAPSSSDAFGRHSGLKCIAEFRQHAARCFKPRSAAEATDLLRILAS